MMYEMFSIAIHSFVNPHPSSDCKVSGNQAVFFTTLRSYVVVLLLCYDVLLLIIQQPESEL